MARMAEEPILVFFGIEISAPDMDSEILQIYMKRGDREFNRYITPTKEISTEMSAVNHLTFCDSALYRDAERLDTSPRRQVLKDLHAFLKQFGRPCTLVAHKFCYANSFRLLRAMKREMFAMKFNNVVAGFTCSLDLYAEKFPGRDVKDLTIHKLKKEAAGVEWKKKTSGAGRRIEDDAGLLEQLVLRDFSTAQLAAKRSFALELKKYEKKFPNPKPSGNKYPKVGTAVHVQGKPGQIKGGRQQRDSSEKVGASRQLNFTREENDGREICFRKEAGSGSREIGTSRRAGGERQRDSSRQAGGDRPAVSERSKGKATENERMEMKLQSAQARKRMYLLSSIQVLAEMEKPKEVPHFSSTRNGDPKCLRLRLNVKRIPKSFVQSSRTRKGDPFFLVHVSSGDETKRPSRIAKKSYFNTKLLLYPVEGLA